MRITALLMVLALVAAPAVAWEQQGGAFHETEDGSSGGRADAGVHPSGASVVWRVEDPGLTTLMAPNRNADGVFEPLSIAPLALDRNGHVLQPAVVENAEGIVVGAVVAYDTATGSEAWRTPTSEVSVDARCLTVAEDGLIWTVSLDLGLVPLDPLTGRHDPARALPLPFEQASCSPFGLALLPGGRIAIGSPDDTVLQISVVDLATGEVTAELPANPNVLMSSPDGSRVYVLQPFADGRVALTAFDPATGNRLGGVDLPGNDSRSLRHGGINAFYVDAEGGVVVRTGEENGGNEADGGEAEDRFISRVLDDGAGGLSLAWSVSVRPEFWHEIEWPSSLAPAGRHGELIAVRAEFVSHYRSLATGELVTEMDYSGQPDRNANWHDPLLVDAAGNIVYPTQGTVREEDGNEYVYGYVVMDPSGKVSGISPPNVPAVLSAVLLPDGTLIGQSLRQNDLGPSLAAISPGAAGAQVIDVPLQVSPPSIGQLPAGTVQVLGGDTAAATELVLTGADGTSARATLEPSPRRFAKQAVLDLTGLPVGPARVGLVVDGVERATDETVEIQPPDDKALISLSAALPSAIRNGTEATGSVTVSNQSNVDALNVPVLIEVDFEPGTDRRVEIDAPLLRMPDLTGNPGGDRVAETGFAQGPESQFAIVIVPRVPAKGSTAVPLRLVAGPEAPFTASDRLMRAYAPGCWYQLDAAGGGFAQPRRQPPSDSQACRNTVLGDVTGQAITNAVDAFDLPGPYGAALGCVAGAVGARAQDALLNQPPGAPGAVYNGTQTAVLCAADIAVAVLAPELAIAWTLTKLVVRSQAIQRACRTGGEFSFGAGGSLDPNDIVGPAGSGLPERWVQRTDVDPMAYRIRFENLPEAAFAAQRVLVTTTLDDGVDPATFELGALGWSGLVLEPPAGARSWQTVHVPDGADFAVGISAGLEGREVRWELTTLDLDTFEPTDDPVLGFLPPNTSPPQGDGFVAYSVRPRGDADEGATVGATASIVFDNNLPVVTNEWVNTLDGTDPDTTLELVPPEDPVGVNRPVLRWTATDALSGIGEVVLEQEVDGRWEELDVQRGSDGAFRPLQVRDGSLRVRAIAIDRAGNVDKSPPEATWTVATDAVNRTAGPTRIETAVDVSRSAFPRGAFTAVLATGDTYPDSLSGAPLAAALAAPLLLNSGDGIHPAVAAELQRLGAERVVILGGAAAVPESVEANLADLGIGTVRISGANRWATAVAVADQFLRPPGRVFVTLGDSSDPAEGWPEALIAAPWAAQRGEPLLLTAPDQLVTETAEALARLAPAEVVVVGDETATSAAVVAEIARIVPTVTRVTAEGRVPLSVAVTSAMDAEDVGSPRSTHVVTGGNFPDALAVGAAVAATGGRLLMVSPDDVGASQPAIDRVADYADQIEVLNIAGGSAAVSPAVEEALRAALRR